MKPSRNIAVDVIKLFAAFGVVMIHLAPSTPAAETLSRCFLSFAVPFFVLSAMYFLLEKVRKNPFMTLQEMRFDRLMVPYASWTTIYMIMRYVKFRSMGKPMPLEGINAIFYGASAVHLYFLPLLLVFQGLLVGLFGLFAWPGRRCGAMAMMLSALVFGAVGCVRGCFGFDGFLTNGLIYGGLAICLNGLQSTVNGRRCNVLAGSLWLAFLICASLAGIDLNVFGVMFSPLIAYGLCAMALNVDMRLWAPSMARLLSCSFAIYLAHFAFLESFEYLAERSSWEILPYSVVEKLLLGILICACCVLMARVVRLHWLSAYLLLGEAGGPSATRRK